MKYIINKIFYINLKIMKTYFSTENFTVRNIWRISTFIFRQILIFFIFYKSCILNTTWVLSIYMSRICHRRIFFMVVQSYFAIISREWCFSCDMNVISSAREHGSRGKLKISRKRGVILFGKKYHRKSGPWWCWSAISSRPTFERIAATNPICEFRSEWRLHYSGVIGFLATDVIVAVISVSYSPASAYGLRHAHICVYLFYIDMQLFQFNEIFIMHL